MKLERAFLVGEKIYLQPMDIKFYEDQYLDWVNNDEIIDNMASLFIPTTEEGLLNYIRENTSGNEIAFFAVRWKENNDFIGTAKLGPIDWVHRKAYYGILVGNEKYRNKGAGTDVARVIVSYGFNRLNLHWIGAGLVSENVAAMRCYEKAGLRTVAVIPKQLWFRGRYVDNVIMGITAEEYYESTRS
jgi:RimJ/RimL family protein N-acetyltransferase